MQDKKKNLSLIITIIVSLILIAGTGVGVYFWQRSVNSKQQTDNKKQVEALQKQINELKSKPTMVAEEPEIKDKYTDKEEVLLEALRKAKTTYNGGIATVFESNVTISDKWAKASPTPFIKENEELKVPGMGGVTYVFEKANGGWTYIGSLNEGGPDEQLKTRLSDIPETFITPEERINL
ncbi:MAG: hypothetical protein M1355_00685 [Patescibacteria group bacterium]|nr:hypothetical protein [Patescibacteria group bacterium]MCL5093642.1 hypothetical protein [Patescibacteria group bacterium]